MTKPETVLSSMTGFARVGGHWRDVSWQWELKSVNGKALDMRFRLPSGFDNLEAPARGLLQQTLKRGNLQINLALQTPQAGEGIRVNAQRLDQLVVLAENLRDRLGSAPIQAENLLALRGVLEVAEESVSEDDMKQRDAAILASFETAARELVASRQSEGKRLATVLQSQLDRITSLTIAARQCPARQPEAIRQRLAEQVARLLEQSQSFDEQRLHQEALLLTTRADVQEELDRLQSHLEAADGLLQSHEPVGRKFDFLTQEFNREANTLCSKATDKTLTSIGLDLKTVIDQLREQVQNIE